MNDDTKALVKRLRAQAKGFEKRIYYAHPVTDYGTAREHGIIREIESLGLEVINPADHQEGYEDKGMDHFYELVDFCDALVFSRFPEGELGAGVYGEIKRAIERGKIVFEWIDWPPKALSVEETRALIKSVRGV